MLGAVSGVGRRIANRDAPSSPARDRCTATAARVTVSRCARAQLLEAARMTRPTRPPGAALWLLERRGPHSEAAAGGIAERFAADSRSVAWPWRQVLVAIAVAAVHDIRRHKLLAVASVAAGFLIMQSVSQLRRCSRNRPRVQDLSRPSRHVTRGLRSWWSATTTRHLPLERQTPPRAVPFPTIRSIRLDGSADELTGSIVGSMISTPGTGWKPYPAPRTVFCSCLFRAQELSHRAPDRDWAPACDRGGRCRSALERIALLSSAWASGLKK